MDYSFDVLPGSLQETIRTAIRGEPTPGVIVARLDPAPRPRVLAAALLTLVAASLVGLLAFRGGLSEPAFQPPLGLGSAVPWVLGVAGALGFAALRLGPVLASRRSQLRPVALATPELLVVVRRDEQPVTLERWRDLRNAVVASAWIEVRFKRESYVLPLVDPEGATRLIYFARDTKARLDGEPGPHEEKDAIALLEHDGTLAHPGPRERRPGRLLGLVAALAGGALALGAWALGAHLLERDHFLRALQGPTANDARDYRAWAARAKAALGSWQTLAPFAEHEAEALAIEDDRMFAHAKGDSQALLAYLSAFSHGRHAAEVPGLEDEAAFAQARAAPGVAALENYVSFHRQGRHLPEADELLFERAKTSADLVQYRALLPQGSHAAEVGTAIDDATFAEALASKTAVALRAYSERFAPPRHADEARAAIAALYRAGAARFPDEGLGALLAWLEKNPRSALRIAVHELQPGSFAEAVREAAATNPFLHPADKDLTPDALRKLEGELRDVLARAFEVAYPEGLVPVAIGAEDSSNPALVVSYRIVPTGESFMVESKTTHLGGNVHLPDSVEHEPYLALRVVASVELRIPGATEPRRSTFGGDSAEKFTLYTGWGMGGITDQSVYVHLVSTALQNLRQRLLEGYGLPKDPPAKAR